MKIKLRGSSPLTGLLNAETTTVQVNTPAARVSEKEPSATGMWREEGDVIAYTHSHMPFPDKLASNEMKRLPVVSRTPERIDMRNHLRVARVFHRCPAGSLNAPANQNQH